MIEEINTTVIQSERSKTKQLNDLAKNYFLDKEKTQQQLIKLLYSFRGEFKFCGEYRFTDLIHPLKLTGVEKVICELYLALLKQQKIIIVGDFDADGATSTALAILSLKSFGFKQIEYMIPSRFTDGYGLNIALVQEAYQRKADIILTVDNGITAFDGVDKANELGIKVIITDHHLASNSIPNSPYIINPNIETNTFPSKCLAGVGVVFYLMLAFRAYLREKNYFSEYRIPEPNLGKYLDLVALGTIADLVPLDLNNRILVYHGIKKIQSGKCRPGIAALVQVAKKNLSEISSKDLGFILAPRLNAAGRLDDMSIGVELLICNDPIKSIELAEELNLLNESRKEIELSMQEEALKQAETFFALENDENYGLSLFDPDWHQGIIGLIASRVKEKIKRPVFAFACSEDLGILKGSGRSITGIHLRDILDDLNKKNPMLIEKFGGHAMAAGLSIKEENLAQFKILFNKAIESKSDASLFRNQIHTDGMLPSIFINIDVTKAIKEGGPWGQGFHEPLFNGYFKVLNKRVLKDKHLKLILEPIITENSPQCILPLIDAIAFNVDSSLLSHNSMKFIHTVFKLDVNYYRDSENLQLLLEYIKPLDTIEISNN